MEKFFVQVLIVKEIEVEASDELQAERAAYAKLGSQQHNAIGMKVFNADPEVGSVGAMADDNRANMAYVRHYFHSLNVEWCEQEAV